MQAQKQTIKVECSRCDVADAIGSMFNLRLVPEDGFYHVETICTQCNDQAVAAGEKTWPLEVTLRNKRREGIDVYADVAGEDEPIIISMGERIPHNDYSRRHAEFRHVVTIGQALAGTAVPQALERVTQPRKYFGKNAPKASADIVVVQEQRATATPLKTDVLGNAPRIFSDGGRRRNLTQAQIEKRQEDAKRRDRMRGSTAKIDPSKKKGKGGGKKK